MVSIDKLLVITSLLVSGFISAPVDANLPEGHEGSSSASPIDPEASGEHHIHISDKLNPDLTSLRASPKKPVKTTKPKMDITNLFGDFSDVGSIIQKLGSPEGQTELMNTLMGQVNNALDEAGGEAINELKGMVDGELASLFPKASTKDTKPSGKDNNPLAALGGFGKLLGLK